MKVSIKKRFRLLSIGMLIFIGSFYGAAESGKAHINEFGVYNSELFQEEQLYKQEGVTLLANTSNYTAAAQKNFKKSKPVVVIDAGHGGGDSGAIGLNKSQEKDNTLAVALKLGKILEAKGVAVIYTRKTDKITWSMNERANLQARTDIANKAGADLFISIHNNSSNYKSVSGIETYYFPGSSKGKSLAGMIQNQVVSSLKVKNREIRSSNFYVLRYTNCPAVLVELGYITNANEEYRLKNKANQDKYAEAIAGGIMKYLNK